MHKKTYKNLLKLSTIILMMSALLNLWLTRQVIIQKYGQESKAQEKTEEIERLIEANIETITNQLNEAYNKTIKESFTQEELENAMQRQWQYIINANGTEIKSSKMYVKPGNIRIMVAEVLKEESILAEEILKLGSLDKAIEHTTLEDLVEVYSTVPYKVKREETDEGIKYYYDFTDVPSETLIVLKLSPLITERLGYKDKIKEDQITLVTKE
nr:hypothetical protein [uncultured Cellulosilyticum sp.]